MILIGISGKKGVGKDLFASYLREQYGFIPMSFAAELKAAVRRDFNFTKEHTDGSLKESPTQFVKEYIGVAAPYEKLQMTPIHWTPREIMVEYGQFFRQFNPEWWINRVFDHIGSFSSSENVRVAITDVRFRNEADLIKARGGYVVRLNRPQELNIYKTPSTDISETDLDTYEHFDFNLAESQNVTQEDLREFAERVFDTIINTQVSKRD